MNDSHDQTVLRVEGLTIAYGDREIVSDVAFDLRRNEILGIVGETGAGKSLLARSLLNLLPPGVRIASGKVSLAGKDVAAMQGEELRQLRGGRIALIGTNAKSLLDPVRTVGLQVASVLQAHRAVSRKEAVKATIGLFAKVGIVDPQRRFNAYPHELSGGMAQRVVIAMAMIADPEVMLADDATLGLDATIQVQVLDMLVASCRERGMGAILVTHDLGIIAHFCDRVAIMKEGRIVEIGDVATFLEKPKQAYSRTLLEAARARPVPMAQEPAAFHETKTERPLVDVVDLVKLFATGNGNVVRAVDGVSFSVRRNQTLALVGESGSGKTTIGQCLVQLLQSNGGAVVFDGRDILGMPQNQFRPLRRRIQMVFQEPYVALNPRWTVAELMSEPLSLVPEMRQADRAKRVRELFDLVHMPAKLADVYPHELTAGEQKRVGIARALATKPDFVIFDEPTTALDIRVRAQIIDLVRNLQQELGMSALFITHDLNSVRSLAHNVAVMRHGKIVETGDTETIFSAPAHDYTRKLLSAELPIERRAEIVSHAQA